LLLAGIDGGHIGSVALAQGGEIIGRDGELARGGAQSEEPFLGLLELARVELGRAQRLFQGRARLVDGVERRGQSFDGGSTRAGACAARRSSLRTAAERTGTGDPVPEIASTASLRSWATFSDCIMTMRRSARLASSPGCGFRTVSSSTA